MRVLFVTQVIDRTHENLGAIHGWIEALAGEVERVHAVALQVGETRLPRNVSTYSLGKDRGHGKARQLLDFQSLVARLALGREVDVFFPHMIPRYAMLLAPYRLLLRIPSVMWYSHNTADLRLRVASRFVDSFVTVSRDSFPLASDRCEVVGHGIETDVFAPVPREQGGPTRFLSLGRICARKDQDTLVSAADALVNRMGRRDVEVVIAGGPLVEEDHAYLARLRRRVDELELGSHVRFTGSVPHSEAVHLVQASDFFVNMHVEGGLGKAVLEAMSCGKPAFVSTPTYYERFPDYAGAFIFPPRDHETLARKMAAAADLPAERREAIGADLRQWVLEEHDVRRQMSRIAGVLRSVTGGK